MIGFVEPGRGGQVSTEAPTTDYEPHIGETRQYWRDIILGVNDGLVSIFLLVAGVVGGGLNTSQVLLTAVAGSVAGAVSMAAGEYLATKSQDEVLAAELSLERVHLAEHRPVELQQLHDMFREMGIHDEDIPMVVDAFDRSDIAMLNAMKALEFGVVDSERRSPFRAMAYSGVFFLAGSVGSVIPFLWVDSVTRGMQWTSAFTALGLFSVGVAKARVARTSPVRSGLENLMIAGLGGAVAFLVGRMVGTN